MTRTILAVLCAAGMAAPAAATAKDYLVTMAKPSNLYVFDAAERSLIADCDMGVNISPGIFAMSPDGGIAYGLVNRWQDVIGIDIRTCERVFYAAQSEGDVTRRSIGSIAVSPDGSEIYTVRNPTRHLPDRYEVMEPEFAVFDAAAGTDAKPLRIFPAPRRSTIMAADRQGTVYIAGHDIYAVDPGTGEVSVKIANATWDRPTYGTPDVLAFWPVGTQNDEFLLIIGGDSLAEFHTWHEPQRILEEVRLVVYGRKGSDIPAEYGDSSQISYASAPLLDISSTEIRRRCAAGQTVRFLLPDAVRRYIEAEGLYHTA